MRFVFASICFAVIAAPALAQGLATTPPVIETVTLHRIYNQFYVCGEHRDGELPYLGDALGTDCMIEGGASGDSPVGFFSTFRGDGSHNEDWYGWNAEVLAPFDGRVVTVHINAVVNQPGHPARAPASVIVFERADGLKVILAHVQDVQVAAGDTVHAGQVVAHVGDNGYARNPHIHIGAWKDQTPYQIRWDLRN